jgi:hypothetical protein
MAGMHHGREALGALLVRARLAAHKERLAPANLARVVIAAVLCLAIQMSSKRVRLAGGKEVH